MDASTLSSQVLAMSAEDILNAYKTDSEFAESCRFLCQDNNSTKAMNHIVDSLWNQL
jgi:hypothetical protein